MDEIMVQNHELAASASAAQAKAEIECAYVMAVRRPRKMEDVRDRVLASCRRPVFAESATYSKPVAGKPITGPSIRFVEMALQALGNVRTATTVVYEDDQIRKVHVSMTDLENNNAYGLDCTLQKAVERKQPKKGQKVLGERLNSYGEKVYLVEATEDDMVTKQNAAVSKLIRTCGLRLIPQDIVEEGQDMAKKTRESNQGDPDAAKKRVLDGFSFLGIRPSDVEKILGKKLEQALPADIDKLRTIYTAIKEGEATLTDYIETVIEPSVKDKIKAAKDAPKDKPAADPFDALSPQQIAKARGKLNISKDRADLTAEDRAAIVGASGEE